jgi:hypothetical protein
MQTGMDAARAVLVQVRDGKIRGEVAAGMIEAALPASQPSRAGFMLVLGTYVASALEGAAIDPEYL